MQMNFELKFLLLWGYSIYIADLVNLVLVQILQIFHEATTNYREMRIVHLCGKEYAGHPIRTLTFLSMTKRWAGIGLQEARQNIEWIIHDLLGGLTTCAYSHIYPCLRTLVSLVLRTHRQLRYSAKQAASLFAFIILFQILPFPSSAQHDPENNEDVPSIPFPFFTDEHFHGFEDLQPEDSSKHGQILGDRLPRVDHGEATRFVRFLEYQGDESYSEQQFPLHVNYFPRRKSEGNKEPLTLSYSAQGYGNRVEGETLSSLFPERGYHPSRDQEPHEKDKASDDDPGSRTWTKVTSSPSGKDTNSDAAAPENEAGFQEGDEVSRPTFPEDEEWGWGPGEWNLPGETSSGVVQTMHVGGLFGLTQKRGQAGHSELAAAQMAIQHVNDQGVVPGYRLQLLYNDTQCDPGVATDAFYNLVYRHSHVLAVVGTACPLVTKTLAEIVPYWNLILISYANTSPALSEREKYRTFFQLAPGDSSLNPARRMLLQHFQWDTVTAFYEDLEMYSLAMGDISEDFESHNITLQAAVSFKELTEIPEKMRRLKELDARIIVGGFSDSAARQVFCEAYRQGLYGRRYVWLLVGGYLDAWWNDTAEGGCTNRQLAQALDGFFTVSSLNDLSGMQKSVANLTSTDFKQRYLEGNGSRPISMYAATAYDTIWTLALTFRRYLSLEWRQHGRRRHLHDVTYEDLGALKDRFIDIIENLDFLGISGPVSFKGSDREAVAVIYQNRGGNFSAVAVHSPGSGSLDFNCSNCRPVTWPDGHIPRAKMAVLYRQKTIDATVFSIAVTLCCLGVVLATAFLAYNLHHRKLRYIKLSSPKLNNVAVVGCILVYAAVILLGVDDSTLAEELFPLICTLRVLLLAAGFSLAFGAMFAKTFRVHQIFTRVNSGLIKSKLLQDVHLLFIIGALLLVDSGLVFVWLLVDPMHRNVTNVTREVSSENPDLLYMNQLTTCNSVHLEKWLGAFYAYKGLLLIFGVYMAWETRHVKIPALNDSQYIGMNVYNVVIMSIAVVVISNILSSRPTLAYAMTSAFMFLSTTVTLCLLFVPKIYVIVTSGGNPVIASSGIHVEANTRRFIVDDRKEIYYRAEVQNRVYKRELVELDQEISRLERLLELPVQPYPQVTEELLFLLPESKVDATPPVERRRKQEIQRCHSISDGGEVCLGLSESDDVLFELPAEQQRSSANNRPHVRLAPHATVFPNHTQVPHPERPESTLKKLCRLTRTSSVSQPSGSGSGVKHKHQWRKLRALLSASKGHDSSSGHLTSTTKSRPGRALRDEDLLDGQGSSRDFLMAGLTMPTLDKVTQTSLEKDSPPPRATMCTVERLEVVSLRDVEICLQSPSDDGSGQITPPWGDEVQSEFDENELCELSLFEDRERRRSPRSQYTAVALSECACAAQSRDLPLQLRKELETSRFPTSLAAYEAVPTSPTGVCGNGGGGDASVGPSRRGPTRRRLLSTKGQTQADDTTEHFLGADTDDKLVSRGDGAPRDSADVRGKIRPDISPGVDPGHFPGHESETAPICREEGDSANGRTLSVNVDLVGFLPEETELSPADDVPTPSCLDVPRGACARSGEPEMRRVGSLTRIRGAKTFLEHERRRRIRKLQEDLLRIQRELEDLDEFECKSSDV